jgi:chloride channel protein, CIC family
MRSPRDFGFLLLARLRPSLWQQTLALAAGIGVLGALATIGFRGGIALIERLVFGRGDSLVQIATGLAWWQRLIAPAVGGIIAGLLLQCAQRAGTGRTGGDYMEAVSLGDGQLPVRQSLLRALSSAATVSSGGAIGREGPMVQLAALCGSLVGAWQKAPIPRRRLLVACGAAAGVATAYNAPIAGALFVAEIVLHSLAIDTVGALLVAAVAANLVVVAVMGPGPIYRVPMFVLPAGSATLSLATIGVVAGLVAPGYLWALDRSRALFSRWPAPPWLRLAAGGLIVGAISIESPTVWGNGYSVVNSVLGGGWPWQALLLVLVLKLAAVAATTGSGAVGGIFTPTLFVGAIAGALCAAPVGALWPGGPPASASVAVGMGAFLAACTHAPLTSVLMIFEMTADYSVVVPLMLACVLGFSISRALRPQSIYSGAAGHSVPAPALTVAGDFARADSATVLTGSSVRQIESVFLRYRWPHVYVLDRNKLFLGAISIHDLTAELRSSATTAANTSQDWPAALVRTDYPRVTTTTPVWRVLEIFATHAGERLPVLDDSGHLVGHVTKTDLVLMFRERLASSTPGE